MERRALLTRYRIVLGLFVAGMIMSGLTALPLEAELTFISRLLGISNPSAYADMQGLRHWIAFVCFGLQQTYARFPFLGYGTDWLAFGHFVIAAFFFLPLRDPVRYSGVLRVGLVACAGVFAVALICGPLRGIPFYWQLIDCSFGIIGAIPLLYCLSLTRKFR
jgi:hypothetical protein